MILARFADHPPESLAILRVTPFLGCGEFARFVKDFAESVGESIEATARGSVWQGATKLFERVLSSSFDGHEGVYQPWKG